MLLLANISKYLTKFIIQFNSIRSKLVNSKFLLNLNKIIRTHFSTRAQRKKYISERLTHILKFCLTTIHTFF